VEKELGERRAVGFSGVGLGVSKRLDFESVAKEESTPDSVSYLAHYPFCQNWKQAVLEDLY